MLDANARLRLLSEEAALEFNPSCSIQMYYRSCHEMVRMANIYAEEGNLRAAYVLYLRFISIFVEKIPLHPQYRQVTPAEKAVVKRYLQLSLGRAETIKAQLRAKFEQEYDQWQTEQKERESALLERQRAEELERVKQSAIERQRQKFDEEKRALLESERLRTRLLEESLCDPQTSASLSKCVTATETSANQLSGNGEPAAPSLVSSSGETTSGVVPQFDRSVKPKSGKVVSLLSVRSELRTIVVPDVLMPRFLALARDNTDKNIETCALLCGRPQGVTLRITHLLVPRQRGGADWCVTEDEHEILAPMEQLSLITLGWIHTHPTQTAFLSSMDLHTHYSHQTCMAESVAIVCAPKYDETGFFHLTPDYGLNFIGSCDKTGFHPHPDYPPLFADAQHVTLDPGGSLDVIDMRH